MKQGSRPRSLKALGLFLAGPVAAVAVYAAAAPFDAANAFSAMTETAERSMRLAQANVGEVDGETSPELAVEPPTEPVAEGEAEAPEPGEAEVVAEEEVDRCCDKGDRTPPFKLIAETAPGELNNPYGWKELAEENQKDPDYLVKQFRLPGCGACHGASGGGRFCPTLNKGIWSWGNTDDVLFRLIALGSIELEKQGWTRYQQGETKAPMPEMGHVVKTSDQLWRIIAYIRSINPSSANPPEKVIPGQYTPPPQVVTPE